MGISDPHPIYVRAGNYLRVNFEGLGSMKHIKVVLVSLVCSYLFYLLTYDAVTSLVSSALSKIGISVPENYQGPVVSALFIVLVAGLYFIYVKFFPKGYKYTTELAKSIFAIESRVQRDANLKLADAIKNDLSKIADPEKRREEIYRRLQEISDSIRTNFVSEPTHRNKFAASIMDVEGNDLKIIAGVNGDGSKMASIRTFQRQKGFCGCAWAAAQPQCGSPRYLYFLKDHRFLKTTDESKRMSYACLPIVAWVGGRAVVVGILNLSSGNRGFFSNSEDCVRQLSEELVSTTELISVYIDLWR